MYLLPEEVRFLAATKLFELGKISSEKAAKIAGLDRASFLEKLGHSRLFSKTILPFPSEFQNPFIS